MKKVILLLACVAGFVAGLLGSNLVTPAHAVGGTVIKVRSDQELADKCDFGKTITLGFKGLFCVQK